MKTLDLIIKNARQLLTLSSKQEGPRTKDAMEDLEIIEDGAVAVSGNKIVGVGRTTDILDEIKICDETKIIDAKDKVVLPGCWNQGRRIRDEDKGKDLSGDCRNRRRNKIQRPELEIKEQRAANPVSLATIGYDVVLRNHDHRGEKRIRSLFGR